MPEKEETMKSLYVVVVEVNREHTSGIEERMETPTMPKATAMIIKIRPIITFDPPVRAPNL